MRLIEGIAARLDQSFRTAANVGMELATSSLSSENQIRNAIWRCIFCGQGPNAPRGSMPGRRGVGYYRNRELYLGRVRDAAAPRPDFRQLISSVGSRPPA